MPEISVIVPVYKAEDYLHACVDSILSQTVSDFELILVDDGSPDGCGAICDDYAARDSRVRVIHQENGGHGEGINQGLKHATGTYFKVVDSDDTLSSDFPGFLDALEECERQGGVAAAESGAAMSMCRMLEAPEMPEDFSAPVEVSWELLSMEEAPLTALFALVFKSNYWLVAAAIQAESLLKVPLCALRIRTGKWIHDVTLPQGEL
mgnify:CR=1 FL=1